MAAAAGRAAAAAGTAGGGRIRAGAPAGLMADMIAGINMPLSRSIAWPAPSCVGGAGSGRRAAHRCRWWRPGPPPATDHRGSGRCPQRDPARSAPRSAPRRGRAGPPRWRSATASAGSVTGRRRGQAWSAASSARRGQAGRRPAAVSAGLVSAGSVSAGLVSAGVVRPGVVSGDVPARAWSGAASDPGVVSGDVPSPGVVNGRRAQPRRGQASSAWTRPSPSAGPSASAAG